MKLKSTTTWRVPIVGVNEPCAPSPVPLSKTWVPPLKRKSNPTSVSGSFTRKPGSSVPGPLIPILTDTQLLESLFPAIQSNSTRIPPSERMSGPVEGEAQLCQTPAVVVSLSGSWWKRILPVLLFRKLSRFPAMPCWIRDERIWMSEATPLRRPVWSDWSRFPVSGASKVSCKRRVWAPARQEQPMRIPRAVFILVCLFWGGGRKGQRPFSLSDGAGQDPQGLVMT